MILFRLPHNDATAGGTGASYAARMAQCLTEIGHPAAVTDRPGGPGDTVIIDGLCLPDAAVPSPSQTIALLHHAASRPAPDKTDRAVREAALRLILPQLKRVVCTSAATASVVWDSFGVRAAVVHPGADALPRAEPQPGPLAILSAGVLTRRKGHELLMHALSRLTDQNWTLTIAGHGGRDPAYEQALATQAAAPGLAGRVLIVRDPDGPTLDALYHRASLAVLLTRWEGYPAGAAQALGRGIALVTTQAGAAELPSGAGLVVELEDGATLSKVLRRVLQDDSLRRSLAESSVQAGAALPGWPTQAALFQQVIAPIQP